MAVRRECCNYCMWFGPVNKDGSMRKHRPARDDGTVGGRKVQDMRAAPCPGSRQPYARFGCDETTPPADNPQERPVATTEYGIFNDEGCLEAQCWSPAEAEERRAAYMADDPECEPTDYVVHEICPDHAEQPRPHCEDCFTH